MNYNELAYMYAVERLEDSKKGTKKRNLYKDKKSEYSKEHYNTIEGRAYSLVNRYKNSDIEMGRGNGTLTPDQLIKLWNDGCYWCGETDWHKLGADRIDNSKPHTLENCVCCCNKCNNERQKKPFEVFKKIKNIA